MDILISSMVLLVTWPILLAVWIAIRITMGGPALFRQTRVGQHGRTFTIWKFRTMREPDSQKSCAIQITSDDDHRITSFGRLLRDTKLDELPQLINILRGDMSIVGPRPEVPQFVDLFKNDFGIILAMRPGLTDISSIVFRNESAILKSSHDVERAYITRILPRKIRLAKAYVREQSIALDFKLVLATAYSLISRESPWRCMR